MHLTTRYMVSAGLAASVVMAFIGALGFKHFYDHHKNDVLTTLNSELRATAIESGEHFAMSRSFQKNAVRAFQDRLLVWDGAQNIDAAFSERLRSKRMERGVVSLNILTALCRRMAFGMQEWGHLFHHLQSLRRRKKHDCLLLSTWSVLLGRRRFIGRETFISFRRTMTW